MSKALIARLMFVHNVRLGTDIGNLCHEAAAALERAEERIAELEREKLDVLNGAGAIVGTLTDDAYDAIKAAEARADTLAADFERLEQHLRDGGMIASDDNGHVALADTSMGPVPNVDAPDGKHTDTVGYTVIVAADQWRDSLRAALAQDEGARTLTRDEQAVMQRALFRSTKRVDAEGAQPVPRLCECTRDGLSTPPHEREARCTGYSWVNPPADEGAQG